ncbi:MAG: RnfH family protein [Pseudomonadaceae bacterium]|nr:RnfH family protein [Pseudomonadaceae bacterium]
MSQEQDISVEVVYATPTAQTLRTLQVPTDTTVDALLQQISQQAPFSGLDLAAHQVGIFGQVCERTRVLQAGDRLEIYRPLVMDAKTARLARAQNQKKNPGQGQQR